MNFHLIRSSEVDEERLENVFDIVSKYSGPLKFIPGTETVYFHEKEITRKKFKEDIFGRQDDAVSESRFSKMMFEAEEIWPPAFPANVEIVSWDSIFEKCNQYRVKNNVGNDEHIILLTDFTNNKNWFSAWDTSGKKHSFVHSGQWEYYLPCDPRFPIAYHLMQVSLEVILFNGFKEAMQFVHKQPRGCINDFCKEKKQVTLKLRTADICPDCQQLIQLKNTDPRLIDQVLNTLDGIRSQMLFRERYKTTLHPSRIEIRGPLKRIFLTDLGDAELKLTPLERTVYLLFLEHPEGLHLSEVSDHREWIEKTYKEIGNSRTVAEFRNSIDQLIDPTENSLSEKMSKIKKKIVSLVGEDLGKHYFIEGAKNEKKRIVLNSGMIRNVADWRES